jgi:hypothetical protein
MSEPKTSVELDPRSAAFGEHTGGKFYECIDGATCSSKHTQTAGVTTAPTQSNMTATVRTTAPPPPMSRRLATTGQANDAR